MLKIDDLSYIYEDGTKALENINMDSSKGKVIGIIGANGSGKSTLFLNIMGILKPTKGSISYNGNRLKYNKKSLREYRKEVNIVFQNPEQQIFYSNVYDDIAFSLRNMNMDEEIIKHRVDNALDLVYGKELVNKPVHFLSYGQKKRVAIGGTLVMDSKIILLDEPTSGLDPHMTKQMKKIINNITNDKVIIISSHDMDLIYDICDYIYILSKGNIIGEGKTKEVFLKDNIIKEANLGKPWLVKIHEKFNLPLFANEEEFENTMGQ